jgi:hypothetical protein
MSDMTDNDKRVLDIILPILQSSPGRYGENVMDLSRALEGNGITLKVQAIEEIALRSGVIESVNLGKHYLRYKKD